MLFKSKVARCHVWPEYQQPLQQCMSRLTLFAKRTQHTWFGLDRRKVWLGYQQSLRPCESGLMLNVDLAATAFLEVQV